MTIQLNIC